MTKVRAPLSMEQALQRIAGQCSGGIEQMAQAVQRQASTVRAWMDPDRDEQASVEAGVELDLLFQAEGGEGCPIFEAYGAKLDLAAAQKFLMANRLQDYAVDVIREGGEAHAAIVAAARPGASPTERKIAHKEACEAFEKLRDVIPLLAEGATPPPVETRGETNVPQAP